MELTMFSVVVVLEYIFFNLLDSKPLIDSVSQRDPYFPKIWKFVITKGRELNRWLFYIAIIILSLKVVGLLRWW